MKFFKRYLKANGMSEYGFHSLRKTFVSELINSGVKVFDVMKLARHKDIKTTIKHYSKAELDRMGQEISERANLGTYLGTRRINKLKKLDFGT